MNDLTYIIAIFDTYFCFISYREYNYMLFFLLYPDYCDHHSG